MYKARFHGLLLSALLMAGASAAQGTLPLRGPDYFRDASELASTLGSAHAIRVRCNGREDQYWRQYMADMLSYEAPNRGALRTSLVDQFNDAYQDVSRQYLSCDNNAVEAEARYARQGQEISERMAMHYFPKRPD
ncbi:MAG: TIGR02301 family protein [Hyphomonas sp.]|nr:TIGR02301 family protein [Hyphomonas sp.]